MLTSEGSKPERADKAPGEASAVLIAKPEGRSVPTSRPQGGVLTS